VVEPAGFDDFVRQIGRSAATLTLPPPSDEPPDVAGLAAVAPQYGVEILGRPASPADTPRTFRTRYGCKCSGCRIDLPPARCDNQ
jgi:hypothetical protein